RWWAVYRDARGVAPLGCSLDRSRMAGTQGVDKMPVVTISGTSGANAVTITTAGIYSVNLGSGDDSLFDNVSTIITAHGGVGNDSLSVTESTGLIYGDSGVDTIYAEYGAYTVFGGTG